MNKYQEALNALCDEDEMYKLAKGFSFEDDYTSEYDYEKAKEYCKNKIQELIDNYVWIPVEKRLPYTNQIVVAKWKDYTTDDFYAGVLYRDEHGDWVCEIGASTGEVIAWMPLPEAYGGNQ